MRAPFFAIGSFAIWISTSCPSLSSSLICGTTVFSRLRKRRPPRRPRPRSNPRSGPRRCVRCNNLASGAGPRTTALASTVPSPIASASSSASASACASSSSNSSASRSSASTSASKIASGTASPFAAGSPPAATPRPVSPTPDPNNCPPAARVFFQFLEALIVTRFFTVGREVGFFFLDLLFFDSAVRNLVCSLRSFREVRFLCLLMHHLRRRKGLRCRPHLVPGFRYFRHCAGSGPVHLFLDLDFRVGHVIMLLVKWLGNFRRENRLILGKACNDRGRRQWQTRCALRRRSRKFALPPAATRTFTRSLTRTLAQTLALVLRDRFAGEQDRLISRRRSVIVVATGTSGRRRPLESRVRPAPSRTVAAAKAVIP